MNYQLLSSNQVKRLNDATAEILLARNGFMATARAILDQMSLLLDTSFSVLTYRTSKNHAGFILFQPVEYPIPNYKPSFEHFISQHPILNHFRKNPDSNAVQMNEVISRHHWEKQDLYHSFFKPLEIKHLLGKILPIRESEQKITEPPKEGVFQYTKRNEFFHAPSLSIGSGRDSRVFSKEETLMMDLFVDNAKSLLQREFEWELLLHKTHFQNQGAEPPPSSRENQIARVIRQFDLTQKQGEVLNWLSQGKTNGEIAIILGNSIRTVQGHVDAILLKLQVENRVAAAYTVWSGGRSA